MAGVKVGDAVRFVDSQREEHDALVTIMHGEGNEAVDQETLMINLTHVSSDESKTDPYGRQIERLGSVPHKSRTTAPGYYWYVP